MRKQNSDFQTGFLSEAGSKLKNNDYFGFVELDGYACYVIADGIADMPGENSARLAIESVILSFQEHPSLTRHALRSWVREANRVLLNGDSYQRRKASLTIVVTDYQKMRYAYLGNTRLRMYRNGHVCQMSEDMSLSQDLVEEEKIPKDALKRHEERNNLYAYLGQTHVQPYISKKIKLSDTDIITLYTRGIWENVDETELDDVFAEAGNEVQASLDNVEELLLSRQPQDLDNYTFAAIFVNKIYSDPQRDRKRKKIIIISIVIAVVVIVIIGICIFLYRRRQQQITDMNYYFTNTVEYIGTGNFVRAKEECEKAEELADKVKDNAMRSRLQEYLFVIETVLLADESYQNGEYETARDYYINALDRARYADRVAISYMEQKLDKLADYFSVTDYISLGDALAEREEYEQAEEKYLLARSIATKSHYTEGKEAAMAALEELYEKWSAEREEQRQEAEAQAGKMTAAAELVANGDKACVDGDFAGAKVYYTMALTQYQELGDIVNQGYVQDKLDTVEQKIQKQQEQRDQAAGFEQQGAQAQGAGDYWTAKAQYLQAKNLYLELGSNADVERVANMIAQLDVMIGQ